MGGEVSREVFWEGERAAPFSPPQATARLALVGVTFIGAITEALTIRRGKRDGVRWVWYLEEQPPHKFPNFILQNSEK